MLICAFLPLIFFPYSCVSSIYECMNRRVFPWSNHPCCLTPTILQFLLYVCNDRRKEMEEVTEGWLLSLSFPHVRERGSHINAADAFLFHTLCSNFSIFHSSSWSPWSRPLCSFLTLLLHPNTCWGLDNLCPIFICTIYSYCLEAHFSHLEHGMTELDKKSEWKLGGGDKGQEHTLITCSATHSLCQCPVCSWPDQAVPPELLVCFSAPCSQAMLSRATVKH